jgi:hypothetical protein
VVVLEDIMTVTIEKAAKPANAEAVIEHAVDEEVMSSNVEDQSVTGEEEVAVEDDRMKTEVLLIATAEITIVVVENGEEGTGGGKMAIITITTTTASMVCATEPVQ